MEAEELENYAAAASVDVSGLALALSGPRNSTAYQAGAPCRQGEGPGTDYREVHRPGETRTRGDGDRLEVRIAGRAGSSPAKILPPSFATPRRCSGSVASSTSRAD